MFANTFFHSNNSGLNGPQSQRLSVVSEAEVDVFLELPCFLHDPVYVGNLISSSSASLKPSFIGKYLKQIEERFRMIKFLKEHKPIKIRTYL